MFLLKWMILLQSERNLRAPRGGSEVSQTSLVWEWELRRGNGFPVSSSALGGWDRNRGKTKVWASPGNGRSPWAKLHYRCSSGWWLGVLVAPGVISTMFPVPSHHRSHPAVLTSSCAHSICIRFQPGARSVLLLFQSGCVTQGQWWTKLWVSILVCCTSWVYRHDLIQGPAMTCFVCLNI